MKIINLKNQNNLKMFILWTTQEHLEEFYNGCYNGCYDYNYFIETAEPKRHGSLVIPIKIIIPDLSNKEE